MKFYGEALGQNFMMEKFYDEILKACGAIPSIYFSPMPAVSTIAENSEAEFYQGTITPNNALRAK